MTKHHNTIWRALAGLVLIAMLASLALATNAQAVSRAAIAGPGNAGFNYGEALQKAILFYEAQRSGNLSGSSIPTRFTWRGDSQLQDGQDVGLDLTGGWVDAGDNVKFAFPMSEAVAVLAWGAVEYPAAYNNSGQMVWLKNQLRWANDWFIKAHPSPNVFYGQVGHGGSDHSFWGPIESTNLTTLSGPTAAGQPTNRPSYSINPSCGGGADLAGGVAAAMAASSIVFRNTGDAAYADTLLTHATQLDAFAQQYKQVYTTCITDAQGYYRSFSGYTDELTWSDIWMAKALDAKTPGSGASYWTRAQSDYLNMPKVTGSSTPEYAWTLAWDDKSFASYVLMAQKYPNNPTYNYNADAERWLNHWQPASSGLPGSGGVAYTPGGHARLDGWGSFRYAANTAFSAFVYADSISDVTKKTIYTNFAEQQINYILGQNPRNCSYMMGFGNCPPLNPHHRTAHGAWLGYVSSPPLPATARHTFYGALSGSVSATDGFIDDLNDYVSTEPATDYNAALVGALAKMYSKYGGNPIPDSSFPLPEPPHSCKDEYAAFALSYSSQSNGYQVDVFLENRSAWPATVRNNYSYRYYFTLDSANISDITVAPGQGGTISGPTLYDATNKIYYITKSFAGTPIYPGKHMVNGNFNITSSSTWNAANDWSWGGTGATTPWDTSYKGGNNDHFYAANIEVYDGATKLCGNAPGGGTPQPTATRTNTPAVTNTPTNVPPVTLTPTRTATATTPSGLTNTPTATNPIVITNTPTRTSTAGPSPTRTRTPTSGPSATRTSTVVITSTPTGSAPPPLTPTRTPTPTTGAMTATPTQSVGACSPVTSTITVPFTFDGAGTFCWQAASLGGFINSWNTTSVTLNGVNVTNIWFGAGSYPAKINGFYYISYTSSVSFGHFEARP